MKTKFFTRYPLSNEQKERLVFIVSLEERLFALIEENAKQQNSLRKLNNNEIRNLVKESGFLTDKVLDALKNLKLTLLLFSYAWSDKIQDIIDDLIELCPDSVKNESSFKNRMDRIGDLAKQYRPIFRKEIAKEAGAPSFDGLYGTVIIKPVFEGRFDFDEIDIKDYKPQLIKKIACILIELKNSNEESFFVQFDPIEYEQFLNDLISLQIELKTIENDNS
jgi:hypothetical protein